MSDHDELTQKALRAARAVTMSAALLGGGTGCGEDPPDDPDDNWTYEDEDAATDTGTDTGDTVVDTAEPDTYQPVCSSVSDNACPAECNQTNDRDCCEQQTNCQWYEDSCGCAVPGPFTPPAMLA